jgi:hypothetical protein
LIIEQIRQLGVARSYDELHQILRARKDELNVSCITLDEAAGFTPGHASKLLAPRPLKRLGPLTLGLMLQALGLQLIVVEDAEALKRIRPKLVPREVKVPMLAYSWGHQLGTSRRVVSKRFIRRLARKGGKARAQRLTPVQRSRIAKDAARARWKSAAVSR